MLPSGQIKPLDEEEKNKNIILETFNKYMGKDPAQLTAADIVPPPKSPSIDSVEFRKSTTK